MRPESRKLLLDMRDAADKIAAFTKPRSLNEYLADPQLRWSVEHGFEIIGEALTQLSKLDKPLADNITDRRKIISFRNVLINGYSQIDDKRTWAIVEHNLPKLREELDQLLATPDSPPENP
jgi:uncharacterized protein with HEPN domain